MEDEDEAGAALGWAQLMPDGLNGTAQHLRKWDVRRGKMPRGRKKNGEEEIGVKLSIGKRRGIEEGAVLSPFVTVRTYL